MGNIPVLKVNEVIAILIKLGFSEIRQRGSHKQFRDTAGLVQPAIHTEQAQRDIDHEQHRHVGQNKQENSFHSVASSIKNTALGSAPLAIWGVSPFFQACNWIAKPQGSFTTLSPINSGAFGRAEK